MKVSILVFASCLAALGCGAGCSAHSGNTETVCAAHFGNRCTSYEERETAQGKFFRESNDKSNKEKAARDGSTFWPTQVAGEKPSHYLNRVQSANSGGSSSGSSSFGGGTSGGGGH